MKKFLAILLAALMLLASAATAEEIVAQAYSPDLTVDTSENLYASACYGLWTRDIDVDGVQRQPSGIPQGHRSASHAKAGPAEAD